MAASARNDELYPMYFGLSCAFAALDHLDGERGRSLSEFVLRGSAQLLGLLVEKAVRKVEALQGMVESAEKEVKEMKLRRTEDGKANEKVVSIFASHEQTWLAERRKLRRQIYALVGELRAAEAKSKEAAAEVEEKMAERGRERRAKDEALEGETKRRVEVEERLKMAEEVAEELRERVKKEAQDHSAEIWKHKTAFMELVSDHRQLEAEMARALRQTEAAKQQLQEALDQKQAAGAMAEQLTEQMSKFQRDAEQKDKILSAMLRKSKLDTAEKQMLLKEVKISKAKKKQAEMEMDKWRTKWESRHKKSSKPLPSSEAGTSLEEELGRDNHRTLLLLEYLDAECRNEAINLAAVDRFIPYSNKRNYECGSLDAMQQLKDWVRMEAEKYAIILEQKHYAEIEAFTEQMRLKDEKLEAFRWQLLSNDLELKQLQSHIEGLDGTISEVREENLKLETLLLDRDKELRLLKDKFDFYVRRSRSCSPSYGADFVDSEYPMLCSDVVEISKRKTREQKHKIGGVMEQRKTEDEIMEKRGATQFEAQPSDGMSTDSRTNSPAEQPDNGGIARANESCSEESKETEDSSKNSPVIEEEEEEPRASSAHIRLQTKLLASSTDKTLTRNDSWKMDIHALGVSYKIKRLKQQLIVLEKLAGEQATMQTSATDDVSSAAENTKKRKTDENNKHIKGLLLVISLLTKQVKRYQSLEERTDELCRKMHESHRTVGNRDQCSGRTREQIETLQVFLEETFQLQRFMVATGQKMMEIESKVDCNFANGGGIDESTGFNLRQFADIVRNLFKDIQRGLEVRIARIIGDIEGTLACDGILYR